MDVANRLVVRFEDRDGSDVDRRVDDGGKIQRFRGTGDGHTCVGMSS